VIGVTLLLINQAGTIYTKNNLPEVNVPVITLSGTDYVRTGMYASVDQQEYHVLNVGEGEKDAIVPAGRYFVDDTGKIIYRVDPAVNGTLKKDDNGTKVDTKFDAPKTQLMALIINGILERELPWNLVLIGVLIAVTLELAGVPSLPFAVGVYLPLSASAPIFIGGAVRWAVDKIRKPSTEEGDSSPGVLLSSGYIAGGSIAALLVAFMNFHTPLVEAVDLSQYLSKEWNEGNAPALVAFGVLSLVLFSVGMQWLFRPADQSGKPSDMPVNG